ncbi:F-actin-capping protein subunit alpha-like [Artemia franciscana]|uniref:F-actin-capping protein subunit alpha-like n=2 Tax=Artemia franciscana TaxID=6661 RepID=UPI0032DA0ED0
MHLIQTHSNPPYETFCPFAMASTSEDMISDSEKIKIVSDFLQHAPPGEFNEVFSDVRVLLDNDSLLKDGVSAAVEQYNKDQFTSVRIPNSEYQALVTEHNSLGPGRFFDPRTKQSFKYDHYRREPSEFQPYEIGNSGEPWRSALEKEFTEYTFNHYKHGTSSVFAHVRDDTVTLVACIEDHQFQPKNYWNGRWRSQWHCTFTPGIGGSTELCGVMKVQVHYYEDGNVQLVCAKEAKGNLVVTSEIQTAKEFVQAVQDAEKEYQLAICENYQTMSDTTFKALRRQLPVTRTKIDWGKIVSYSIGKELKSQ